MSSDMPRLDIELPPHIKFKKRGHYTDVYFLPKKEHRPKGWQPSIHLGRLEDLKPEELKKKSDAIYEEYKLFKSGLEGLAGRAKKEGSLPDLVTKFKQSEYWDVLGSRTKKDYDYYFMRIEDWSAKNNHPHVRGLTTKAMARFLRDYRDRPRTRRLFLNAFRQLYKIAVDEGLVAANLAAQISLPRSKKPKRKKKLWTEKVLDMFVAECDHLGYHSVGSIATTMIETTQRNSDVVSMVNGRDWKEGTLKYIQQKTGKEVLLSPTQKLRERYEAYPPGDYMMFINEKTRRPWSVDTLSKKAREIMSSIGMQGYILKELRHSQITYLIELNCTDKEIAAFTGHSLQTVRVMLDQHYGETRLANLAEGVVAKIDDARAKRGTK